MRCGAGIEARQVDELFINIDPIQAGGRLTPDAMKAVIAYGDGYSVCDNCRKPNRLDYISKPPIAEFHKDVAAWLTMDTVRTVPGARRGFQAVAHTYVHKGDRVLLTSLSHYTEFLAIEEAGGIPREIPADADHKITPEATSAKIEEVKREAVADIERFVPGNAFAAEAAPSGEINFPDTLPVCDPHAPTRYGVPKMRVMKMAFMPHTRRECAA